MKPQSVGETPCLLDVGAQATAVIRLTVPRKAVAGVMGPAIQDILATLAAQDIQPAGPCFSFHFARPTEIFDFEVGFPVDRRITASGRVYPSILPAAQVARMVYSGGYDGLAGAWARHFAWIEATGLVQKPGLWESYVVGPASGLPPEDWRTELNRPLAG